MRFGAGHQVLVAHPAPDRAVLARDLETGETAVVLTRPVDAAPGTAWRWEGHRVGAERPGADAPVLQLQRPDALVEDQDALEA